MMKYRIEMQPLAGRYVVALKDPETGDLVKTFAVNASAAEMIRLYQDGLDVAAIADTLSQKYGVPADRIHADAEALLGRLK
ncbi:MAG: PqqD family protein [Bacteroidales bacterium]|nr:PqqD family protein [Bacteroidales bacterium]